MPQELLRDVLRAGDAVDRRQRRWSILPLSITAHAVAVAVVLIAPLAAEVDPPSILSPLTVDSFIRTLPPEPPVYRAPSARMDASRNEVPLEAPPTIEKESDLPSSAPGPPVDGAVPFVGSSSGAPPGLGTSAGPPPAAVEPPPPPKLVRVGSGIRAPKKIVDVAPEYPEIARRSRVSGMVMLEAVLDAGGRVQSVRVLRSVPLLDDAAIRAVRQWRYSPTELNGVPVPVLMTITVVFSLQ
jgi:periplasmic protein TonB